MFANELQGRGGGSNKAQRYREIERTCSGRVKTEEKAPLGQDDQDELD